MNQTGAHRYEDRLLEFAYGELPASEARSVEAHVKGCARCTGALEEIRGVRSQMAQLAPEPAPDAGLESLLAYAQQSARRAAAGPTPAPGWRRWVFGIVGVASLAAVLVVVGVVANRPEPAPVSVADIKKEAAKEQLEGRAQERAAPEPAVAAEPAPAQQAQPLEQEKAPEAAQGGAQGDLSGPPLPEAAPKPTREATRTGKQVGREYVQPVDVSNDGYAKDARGAAKADAKPNAPVADKLDTMQNAVPGRGTRPVLPTTNAPGYVSKSAPLPSAGEMVFPTERIAKSKAGNKKSAAPLAGSGGGFGLSTGGKGSVAHGAKDEEAPMDLAKSEVASGPTGTARPSTPPATAAAAPAPVMAPQAQAPAAASPPPPPPAQVADRKAAEEESAKLAKSRARQEAPAEKKKSMPMRDLAPTPAPAAALGAQSMERQDDLSSMLGSSGPRAAPSTAAPAPKKIAAAPSAQELYASAMRAPRGSDEETNGLVGAINAGLGGPSRVDALKRLCERFDEQEDPRALNYCSAWASADPASAMAMKRYREAESRVRRAKAAAKPAETVLDADQAAPAKAAPAEPVNKQ